MHETFAPAQGLPPIGANWLPAPAGALRPILRMYMPDAAVLNGSYEIPAMVKVR